MYTVSIQSPPGHNLAMFVKDVSLVRDGTSLSYSSPAEFAIYRYFGVLFVL